MKILLLNQSFYPDVVASAQHASDLASALAARGHQVTVICSRRAYDDPSRLFPRRQYWRGVGIIRLPCTGFGKLSLWRRTADFASFFIACCVRLLFLPSLDVVVSLTSPPLISMFAALLARLKRCRFIYWILDLNPDEAIAAGYLPEHSRVAALLESASRYALREADQIIVLDRFLAQRIASKVDSEKVAVLPPWSQDHQVHFDADARLAFRTEHRLGNKFVVMYSGNHSPCHPLDGLLEAARQLTARDDIIFCFVGGGSHFHKVKTYAALHNLTNVVCLPYQPFTKLSASLSAADLHVVVMGDPFVGIVHPCKVYNILSLGIPFLYIGPSISHVTEIVSPEAEGRWFYQARLGDVSGILGRILKAHHFSALRSRDEIRAAARFSQGLLLPRLVAFVESASPEAVLFRPRTAFTYNATSRPMR